MDKNTTGCHLLVTIRRVSTTVGVWLSTRTGSEYINFRYRDLGGSFRSTVYYSNKLVRIEGLVRLGKELKDGSVTSEKDIE